MEEEEEEERSEVHLGVYESSRMKVEREKDYMEEMWVGEVGEVDAASVVVKGEWVEEGVGSLVDLV